MFDLLLDVLLLFPFISRDRPVAGMVVVVAVAVTDISLVSRTNSSGAPIASPSFNSSFYATSIP
jgi:hypothetical protein